MRFLVRFGTLAFLAFIGIATLAPPRAQDTATVPVRTLITVTSKSGNERLTAQDVLVKQNKARLQVTDLTPATGDNGGLQLAIVIADTATSSLSNQLPDIAKFIRNTDPQTKVGIFYARNGTVEVRQDFTPDHERAAKALRVPLGQGGAYGSPYLSLMDLMKRWPATQDRQEVLMFSDGVDRFRPGPASPDVQSTYDMAQKQGIVLNNIFVSEIGARRGGHGGMRIGLGQSYLSQITEQTGGFGYYEGLRTPVDMTPYLNQFTQVLRSQYWITYAAHAKNKPALQEIKFSAELPGVKIYAPWMVLIPTANQ